MIILSVKKITLSFAIIFILLFSNSSIAISPQYLGNFCFHLDLTFPENAAAEGSSPQTMKMGVTHTGDAYYLLQATAEIPAIPANLNPAIYTGTAVVIGDEILVTLSGTHSRVFAQIATSIRMRLNSTSLNGSFGGIETSKSFASNLTNTKLISGDVTSIPCQ